MRDSSDELVLNIMESVKRQQVKQREILNFRPTQDNKHALYSADNLNKLPSQQRQ